MEKTIDWRAATPLFVLALIATVAGASLLGGWRSAPAAHAVRTATAEVRSTSRDQDFLARRNHLPKPGSTLLAER
ncbi:MAG: hypothetical protein E7812_01665 [Phenylobacterium sp.]|nr:MAG: hypothetical protein E7812_01665 [Phenylobacterium sp.]